MRKLVLLSIAAAALAGAVAATGALATGRSARKAAVVKISTRTVRGLGTILVDAKGRTLYMFVPDKRKKVTCRGTCAVIWPPVKVAKGERVVAAGKAKKSLLGSDPDPAGGRVVTYAKWPLYTFISDRRPGEATGQALNLNGGLWYVLGPSGKVIKKKLH